MLLWAKWNFKHSVFPNDMESIRILWIPWTSYSFSQLVALLMSLFLHHVTVWLRQDSQLFFCSYTLTVPSVIWNPPHPRKCVRIFRGWHIFWESPGLEGGVLPSPPPGYLRMTRLGGIFPAGAKPFVTESRFKQIEIKVDALMPE